MGPLAQNMPKYYQLQKNLIAAHSVNACSYSVREVQFIQSWQILLTIIISALMNQLHEINSSIQSIPAPIPSEQSSSSSLGQIHTNQTISLDPRLTSSHTCSSPSYKFCSFNCKILSSIHRPRFALNKVLIQNDLICSTFKLSCCHDQKQLE